ncbi:MAG: RodZ domain-containing protein [Candidatus Acidiferrales bacterium]
MSSTPFGEHLRREREMRGVSLDEISAATRISTRFLEAIEKDQWDQLPGGVFNRGFIRSIARFLGLDEDSLVAEYALGNSNSAPAPAAPKAKNRMPRNWQPAATAVVVMGVLLAGGIFGLHRYGDDLSAWIHSRYQAVRAAGKSVPEPASGAPSAATVDPAQVLTLKLQARKAANVKVSADGKIVFDGAVGPGDSRQFDAQSQFNVSASDASAITLDLNGQALAAVGSPGQSGSVTLTRKDLKTAVGGSH